MTGGGPKIAILELNFGFLESDLEIFAPKRPDNARLGMRRAFPGREKADSRIASAGFRCNLGGVDDHAGSDPLPTS